MTKCDYCTKEIETIDKFLIRFVTPKYQFRDKWYCTECFFKLIDDKLKLSELCAEFLVELTEA